MKTLLERATEIIGQDLELSDYAAQAYSIAFYKGKVVIQGDFLVDKNFKFEFRGQSKRFYKKIIIKDNVLFEIIASV